MTFTFVSFCSVLAAGLFSLPVLSQNVTAIFPAQQFWTDTEGNVIHAHGGGLLRHDNKYWWAGESEKLNFNSQNHLNLYSSDDLYNWDFETVLLNQEDITGMPIPPPYVVERPKIIYNAKNDNFVMWIHLDAPNYGLGYVGVSIADDLRGPWKFVHPLTPADMDGFDSRDMTLYQDDDDRAYFIRTADGNSAVFITELDDDYLHLKGGIISELGRYEGLAMFKHKGEYYMTASFLTGWDPNPMTLFRADRQTIHGAQWINLGNPTGSSTTFDSQPAFVQPFERSDGSTLFIYIADRWNNNNPNLLYACYIWLPIEFNDDVDDSEWNCLSGFGAPMRVDDDGDVQCYALDGYICEWEMCPQLPAPDDGHPLTCGYWHEILYGHPGYGDPNHWCQQVRDRFTGPLVEINFYDEWKLEDF